MANLMVCKMRGCPSTMTHSAYAVRPVCNICWMKLPPELREAILHARHEGPRRVAEKLTEAQRALEKGK